MDLRNAGVLLPGECLRFQLKPPQKLGIRKARFDYLEGHDSTGPFLFGFIHDAHAAFA
jgi:hypothetical protein